MPINGMLTLADVVSAGQQGTEWKQQQQDRARLEKQRADYDSANKAFADVIEASKAEWAMNGAQGQYKPNDTTMMNAATARGEAFARAGDWESFFKNEALLSQQRQRIRSNALQQFELDGDVSALAKTIYPTYSEGRSIRSTEYLPGGEAGAPKGAPSGPPRLRVTMDDGSVRIVDPAMLVADMKRSMIDPAKAAEREAEMNFFAAKERIKGDEARKTEGVKAVAAKELEGVKTDKALSLAEVNNGAAQRRTETAAAATLGAARIGAESRLQSARISAEASKPGKRLSSKERLTMVENSFGELTQGGFGSSRVGSATTAAIAEGMEAYLKQFPEATETEAMNAAARKMGIKPKPISLENATE